MQKLKSKSDFKARTWLCTLNNPDQISLEMIHNLTGAVYTVGQLEKGENGTIHFQFYQNFNTQIRLAHYKRLYHKLIVSPLKSIMELISIV